MSDEKQKEEPMKEAPQKSPEQLQKEFEEMLQSKYGVDKAQQGALTQVGQILSQSGANTIEQAMEVLLTMGLKFNTTILGMVIMNSKLNEMVNHIGKVEQMVQEKQEEINALVRLATMTRGTGHPMSEQPLEPTMKVVKEGKNKKEPTEAKEEASSEGVSKEDTTEE